MSATLDKLDTLGRLARHAIATAESAEERDLAQRMAKWAANGGEGSLDTALGLKAWGGVSPRQANAISNRDKLLRVLHSRSEAWADLEPTLAAKRIRREFERYETGRWAREKNLEVPPIGEPAASFWRILRGAAPMPGVKRLTQILKREIQEGV